MDVFERTVNETVLSGIAPVQLHYAGIYDGYTECPLAYMAHTVLFAAPVGTLEDCRPLADDREVGIRLSLAAVVHACRTLSALEDAGRHTCWLSVEGTTSLVLAPDVYDRLTAVLAAEHCVDAGRICVQLPSTVLGLDRAAVRRGLADIKAAGVRIALAPIDADCALVGLMDLPVDIVVLAPALTALATDRNKAGVLAAIAGLVHTMNIAVVADGVTDDDQIRELTAVECLGFVPAPTYSGEFMLPLGLRSAEDILRDEEGV